MNKIIDMSYNKECPICLEHYDNTDNIYLGCRHTFHSACFLKYIETIYQTKNKTLDVCHVCCKQFKCPLCRTVMSSKETNDFIYGYYKDIKSQYKLLKKTIYNLQNESYMLTFKFKFTKLFKNTTSKDVYEYLLQDETLLEQIIHTKQLCEDTKKIMSLYKQIYYEKCKYCII